MTLLEESETFDTTSILHRPVHYPTQRRLAVTTLGPGLFSPTHIVQVPSLLIISPSCCSLKVPPPPPLSITKSHHPMPHSGHFLLSHPALSFAPRLVEGKSRIAWLRCESAKNSQILKRCLPRPVYFLMPPLGSSVGASTAEISGRDAPKSRH